MYRTLYTIFHYSSGPPLLFRPSIFLKYTFFKKTLLQVISLWPNNLKSIPLHPFHLSIPLHLHMFPCCISHTSFHCSHFPMFSLHTPFSDDSFLQHMLLNYMTCLNISFQEPVFMDFYWLNLSSSLKQGLKNPSKATVFRCQSTGDLTTCEQTARKQVQNKKISRKFSMSTNCCWHL